MIKNKLKEHMHTIEWAKTESYTHLLKFCAILFIVFLCCVSCQYYNRYFNLDDDWAGEEAIEQVIKNNTGIDIDLTPSTPEKQKILT